MNTEYWFVVLAGIFSGFIIFGGKIFADMGLSLFQIAMFTSLIVLFLIPITFLKKEWRIKRSMIKTLAIFGLIDAITTLSEFGPVVIGTPVAITVLLLYTQPFWTVIFSKFIFKEKITKNKILVLILALVGTVILINPFEAKGLLNITGIIVSLIGGIGLSGWVIYGKIAGEKGIHPVTTKAWYVAFMIGFLLIAYLILSRFISDPIIMNLSFNISPITWFYLILFTSFALILPHLLYFYGIKKVPASNAGIILLLEPVVGALLATFFLGQAMTLNIIIGGSLILVSNYLVIK
jgi:drug/metabolite transporter (DMT)-like permease